MTESAPNPTGPKASISKPSNNLVSSGCNETLSPPSLNPCLKAQCFQNGHQGSAGLEDVVSRVPQLGDHSAQPRRVGV